jgi:hypothetical protein
MQKVWRWFVHFGVFWGVSHQGETQLEGVGMKAGLIQSILQQKRYVHCILTCLNKYRLPLWAARTISCSKATSALHLNTRKRAARKIKVNTLMMEAVHISEMVVYFYDTPQRHTPEGCHVYTHHHQNLKSLDNQNLLLQVHNYRSEFTCLELSASWIRPVAWLISLLFSVESCVSVRIVSWVCTTSLSTICWVELRRKP